MAELSPELIHEAKLPERAAAKCYSAMDATITAHGGWRSAFDAETQAREAVEVAEADLRRAEEHAASSGYRFTDEHSTPLKQKVAVRQTELSRRRKTTAETADIHQSARALDTVFADFLIANRGVKFRDAAVKPTIGRGETYAAAVTRIRAELDKLADERLAIEHAPAPASDLVHQTLAALDRAAAKGAPDLDPRIRGRDPLKLDRHLEHPNVGVAFLLFLFRDEIAGRLAKMIGNDVRGALTDEERAAKLAALDAKRLDLDRQEEAVILAAEEVGQRIERRLDADPRAILEIC